MSSKAMEASAEALPPYEQARETGFEVPTQSHSQPATTSIQSSEDIYSGIPAPPHFSHISSPAGPPPEYSPRTELLPVVIPQIATSWKGAFMCPFVRAYPPQLRNAGISEEQFLSFVDGFNEAFVASPVFQVTNLAGVAMGQAHGVSTVQLAGTALSFGSTLASGAVSFLRAKSYMKSANAEFLHPAGLHGQVLTTKKLLPKIKYPSEKLELLPIEHTGQRWGPIGSSSGSSSDSDTESEAEGPSAAVPGHAALERRHEALEGYIEPLDFNVAPSPASNNLLKRMGEWQSKRLSEKQAKKLNKQRRKGEKEHRKKGKDAAKEERKMDKELRKIDCELRKEQDKRDERIAEGKLAKAEKEYGKEARKLEKERAKVLQEFEKEIGKHRSEGEQERTKADRKEEKMANKIRWIVITKWVPEMAEDEMEDEDA